MTENLSTTWDGLPISPEPPFGASIVIYRRQQGQVEFLILHRAHNGPEYEGEWAWTPPSGARLPNEAIDDCARRELLEETGLTLSVQPVDRGAESWAIYAAEATLDDRVVLDAEHDRFVWVTLEAALAHCLPEQVGRQCGVYCTPVAACLKYTVVVLLFLGSKSNNYPPNRREQRVYATFTEAERARSIRTRICTRAIATN